MERSDMWDVEMVTLLRHMIDDVGDTPKYEDERLMQLLLVGAQFARQENALSGEYIIDVENLSLKPDPTAATSRDDAFINLTVLKSACLLAGSGLGKGNAVGMLVVEGPYRLDTRGAGADKQLQVKTWCQAYADAKWENATGSGSIPGEAIIGPYRVSEFKGRGYGWGSPYVHRDRMY
jgi:hypothetical protein